MDSPYMLPLLGAVVLGVATYLLWPARSNQVPALADRIPYVSNTYQFMNNQTKFLARARDKLRRSNIVSYYLGPNKVYLVTGAKNIRAMFSSPKEIQSEKFMLLVMDNMMGFPKADTAKFANDKSGRLAVAAGGVDDQAHRYWASQHRIMHDFLARADPTAKLAASYEREFNARLEAQLPLGVWTPVRVLDFMRNYMAEAAIVSLVGPRIFELNPDLLEALWEFDEIAANIAWGPPKWVNRRAWNRRDRLHTACARYLESAWANFDWNGPDADADWEPHFGARFSRELAKWMKEEVKLSDRASAGTIAITCLFGQNANTIPIATWALMELARDPALLKQVRNEVMTTIQVDPTTGQRTLDSQKLLAIPLLQSIYIETMRLHVSMNITREIVEPVQLEGHVLEKGSLLQAPSEIAHYDELTWGAAGHPASEFWAFRHVTFTDTPDGNGGVTKVPQFNMAGRSNDFIPYGGGVAICPGRFFAKQEIILTLAILVARFDLEFIEWTMLDGKPSDRAACNDARWTGAAGVPPDRDMKMRWKRLW